MLEVVPLVAAAAGFAVLGHAQAPMHVHFDGPRAADRSPESGSAPLSVFNVGFHGGSVQTNSVSYAIYWFPKPDSNTANYMKAVDTYFSDVGNSPLYAVAAAYSYATRPISSASTFGKAFLDTTPFPAKLDEAALESELNADIAKLGITPTINTQVFVFLPSGATFTPPTGTPPFCALHGYYDPAGTPSEPVVFGVIPFASAPQCMTNNQSVGGATPNSVPGADNAIANASREQLEMATDPLGDGWYDPTYGEIGQLCYYDYGDTTILSDSGANLIVNVGSGLNYFTVPQAWSQRTKACLPMMPTGYTPSIPNFPNISFHGGPVQPTTKTYAVYWGTSTDFDGSFTGLTTQFLRDIGGSVWYANLTSYTGTYNGVAQTVANGSTFGGAALDSTGVPTGKITAAQVVAEVTKAIAAHNWPIGITSQFYLFLPPKSDYGTFCGEHNFFDAAGSSVPVVYSVYNYPAAKGNGCGDDPFGLPSPDGNQQASRVIGTMAHEMAEMITDPLHGANGSGGTGWNGGPGEFEAADVCQGEIGRVATTIPGANIVINGHGYRLPEIWSNVAKTCRPSF